MSFLIVSVVFFMLSTATAEYIDNSNGHVVFEATIEVETAQFRQRDTSPTKHLIPDKVTVDIKCRDQSKDSELNIDTIEWTPNDDWYMAVGMADDTTVLLMDAHVAEQAFASCFLIKNLNDRYKKQRAKERRA